MSASPRQRPDVTAVITFHREGPLAHKSLLSLSRCRQAAERAGITVEVVATLDRADPETERVVRAYNTMEKLDRLLKLDVGDLGLARNSAIQASEGHRILICDGDDYLSENFIVRCMQSAREHGDKVILHAELIVFFGTWNALWWQTGVDDPAFEPASMLVCNPWNSCCFAKRSTFIETPYQLARPGETGFGFEDWHWNCETLALGHPHHIVPDTTHYVRRKTEGSLNMAHASHNAVIPPTLLFDINR